ncbi:MAG TPA: hypothetical protein ENK26_12140, partial [Gammaproteobacteria bacterium]|nr:hypothetical protein [Gammaproteobacteria bacterium]
MRACGLQPIPESATRLVGARDLDTQEEIVLKRSQVVRLELHQIARLGTQWPVHLHMDNDVLDAAVVPACSAFARNTTIAALSFSGWNGCLPGAGRTADACRSLLETVVRAARDPE